MRYCVALLLVIVACSCACAGQDENIALGASYQILPPATYRLTSEGNTDLTDLTDGVLSNRENIWFDSKAVGWYKFCVGQVLIDLEKIQPIDEVAIRLQGGMAGRSEVFPNRVEVFVGDDRETFYMIDDFRFWRAGDREEFGVPKETGTPWVHTLRFTDLNSRGRYVGIRIRGPEKILTDEVQVFAGDHDPDAVSFNDADEALFVFDEPYVYFHRDTLYVSPDCYAPTFFGVILPPGGMAEFTVRMDVPEGVDMLAEADPEIIGDGTRRYTFDRKISMDSGVMKSYNAGRRFIHLYTGTDWSAGKTGTLKYTVLSDGEELYERSLPIQSVAIGPSPRPERLRTLIGPFFGTGGAESWPGYLDMCNRVGFSAVSAHMEEAGDPDAMAFIQKARDRNLELVTFSGEVHKMYGRAGEQAHCKIGPDEYASGKNARCPSYRGEHLDRSVAKMAGWTTTLQPDAESWGIEIWSWEGPQALDQCLRCTPDFEQSGLESWQEWKSKEGVELLGLYINAVREACQQAGIEPPEIGVYDFVMGHYNDSFWDVSRLHQQFGINSEPSTYTPLHPSNIEYIGDNARETKLQMTERGKVIPWMCPGDKGHFSADQLTWALLECFANGAEGAYFWSGRYWEIIHLRAFADVHRIVNPVEDVIVEGMPISDASASENLRVRGMRHEHEMFVLVSNYRCAEPIEGQVTLPVLVESNLVDLQTGETVASLSDADNTIDVELSPDRRFRAYHVRPQ